ATSRGVSPPTRAAESASRSYTSARVVRSARTAPPIALRVDLRRPPASRRAVSGCDPVRPRQARDTETPHHARRGSDRPRTDRPVAAQASNCPDEAAPAHPSGQHSRFTRPVVVDSMAAVPRESHDFSFDHSILITAAPTRVLAAFFDPMALAVWWQTVRSV